MRKIVIETKKLKEVVNITPEVENILKKFPAKDWML